MRRLIILLLACLTQGGALRAAEPWQTALSQMPLGANVAELNRGNCVDILLRALQSNQVVKAIVIMPGATDEFYMFRRAKAALTNDSPSLLDAVNALTRQTLIRATFRPPMLLMHSDQDLLDPLFSIEHPETARRLKQAAFVPHALYNDRDWDFLHPILTGQLHADMLPLRYTYGSWHFYRHSFAGWNLTGWEALEAIALAGETKFTVRSNLVIYQEDDRFRRAPKVDSFPR